MKYSKKYSTRLMSKATDARYIMHIKDGLFVYDWTLLDELMAVGVDANTPINESSDTALLNVCEYSRYDAIMILEEEYHLNQCLIKQGHNPILSDEVVKDEDFISKETQRFRLALLDKLIGYGINVNAKITRYDVTALMILATNGDLSLIKALVKAGADITAIDDKGRTALWYANNEGHSHIVSYLQQVALDQVAGQPAEEEAGIVTL